MLPQPSSINCPYCNAVVALTEAVPGRVVCPRCAESFARNPAESGGAPSSTLDRELALHRQARTNSRRGLSVWLGGIGVLAALGFGVWWWQHSRADSDPPRQADPPRVFSPSETPALRYLPPGTDSVLAVQLQPTLGLAPTAGNEEIVDALVARGAPRDYVESFSKTFGLTWDQLDQAVIGGKLRNGLEADKLVAIFHLRQPIDEEAFAAQLHATRQIDRKTNRPIFQTARTPTFYWWHPTPQIIVGALSPEALQNVPEQPHDGIDHLDPDLVDFLRHKLSGATVSWAVVQSEKLGDLVALASLFRKDLLEWRDPVNAVRAVVVGVEPAPGAPQITAIFEMKNAVTAQGWRTALGSRFEGRESIRVSGQEAIVQVTLPADRDAIRAAMGKR